MFRVTNHRGGAAIGATLRIDAGGLRQWRTVQRTYSYCASSDVRVHAGLAEAGTVDQVLVRWPGGHRELFGPFSAGSIYDLVQGGGRPAEGG